MFALFRRLLSPPNIVADTHTRRIGQQLYIVTLLFLMAAGLAWVLLLTIARIPLIRMLITIPMLVVFLTVLALLRHSQVRLGATTLVIGMWFSLALVAVFNDGIFSPAYNGLTIVTLCAGLLLGQRAAIVSAIASTLLGLLIVAGIDIGIFPGYSGANQPIDAWIANSVFFVAGAALIHLATNSMAALLHQAESELDERHKIEARLREREAELARSEGRLRSLVAAIPDLAIVLDAEGRYWDVESGANSLIYLPRDQILGRKLTEVLPTDVAERALETIGLALADGNVHTLEYSLPISDRLVHFQARAVAFYDGDQQRVLWLARDITEQRQTLDLLRNRDEVFRRAITAADAVLYYFDYTTDSYTYMTENIVKILGYPTEEITPQLMERIEVATVMRGGSINFDATEMIARARRGELAEWHCDSLVRTRSGELRWLADSSIQFFDANHHVIGAFGILQDITERKQAEEQLRHAQKLQAIGQLAGGLSHDFNNLLTIILGYTDSVIDQARQEQLPDWLAEDLEQIRHAGVRAATLTRQLLAFSRRQVLDLRTLNLNQIIQNMQPMVERLVGPNIRVQAQLAPELGAIRADAGQIEQVIINLAVNARDAMPNGGSLLLETSDLVLDQPLVVRRIEIPPGRYVTLSVTDTGVGMDEATQERIFEPFFTTKAPGQGTGLGLATAHGIVAQSGGQIWFESRAKSGTTFTICLPSIALPAAAAERPQPQPGAPNHETILLVDDDPSIRQIAAIALERHGFQVIQASAEEAEQIGQDKTRTLNLLLTDVIMPGIDGVELAHRLGLVRPELKVLYISGYTDSIIVQRGVSAGSAAFLQKPFTPSALVEKVREVLDT